MRDIQELTDPQLFLIIRRRYCILMDADGRSNRRSFPDRCLEFVRYLMNFSEISNGLSDEELEMRPGILLLEREVERRGLDGRSNMPQQLILPKLEASTDENLIRQLLVHLAQYYKDDLARTSTTYHGEFEYAKLLQKMMPWPAAWSFLEFQRIQLEVDNRTTDLQVENRYYNFERFEP